MRQSIMRFVCFAAASQGCTTGTAIERTTVTDSSGIEITSSASPSWEGGGWSLSEEPPLSIGVVEGESVYQLHRVSGALRLSDGRVAIANSGSNEVRYYDAAGMHLSTVGRTGEGPGEFMRMAGTLPVGGDTILVGDFELRRSTFIDGDGHAVRTVAAMNAAGVLSDGSIIEQVSRPPFGPATRSGPTRGEVALVRHTDGAESDTVAVLPGDESLIIVESDGASAGATGYRRPFGLVRITSAHGAEIFTTDGASGEVRVLDESGDLRRIIRIGVPERPVTSGDVAAWRERFFGPIPPGPSRERALKAHEVGDAFPSVMPAFRAIRHDRDGNLWLEEYRVDPASPARWFVIDRTGEWLGEVAVPAGLRVLDIGDDWVLGVARDELDVEHVLMYDLWKPEA